MKEERVLILSNALLGIFKGIESPVSSDILFYNLNSDFTFPFSYLDITPNEDVITFLPCNKIEKIDSGDTAATFIDYFNNNIYRQEIKIGKLINKISWKFNSSLIEDFVNKYKAYISLLNDKGNFEIFRGDDIPKFYLENSYTFGGGSLNKSCMRHGFCKDYLDIYVFNEKCDLLVLFDKTRNKIMGRALIWKLDEPKDAILMDRIYTVNDSLVHLFISFAEKNGWYYKPRQSHEEINFVFNKNLSFTKMKVFIENLNYKKFPYLDTLQYFNPDEMYLTNDDVEYSSNSRMIRLRDIHGKYKENEYFVFDVFNKSYIRRDEAVYCEIGDCFTSKDSAIYLNEYDKYAIPSLIVKSEFDQHKYQKNDAVFSKVLNTYIHRKKSVKVFLNEINYDFYPISMKDRFYYHYNDDKYYVKEYNKPDNFIPEKIDDKLIDFYKYMSVKI